MDRIVKNVAESCSPFNGDKIEGGIGLNETLANEENKSDTLASEKNTAEEYEIEGRIFKESSKNEKESTKPDAQEAIEDCETIYDKKKKIYCSMTTEKRGTQRTRSTTKTSYKKKVTM